jgi:cytochrome c biogenesis protein CcmG/thiol:disulfide interchange protein DsbE
VTRFGRAAPVLLGLCVLVSAACGRQETPARRGGGSDPFLSIVADDPHGRSLRFADFQGKVRVIDVWATWCGPCRMTIPELNALYERYRARGLVVIGVSVDDQPAAVLEFQRSVPMRYPSVMFNPPVALVIGQPSSIPTTFVVGRDGAVHKTFIGYVDAATLEEEVRRLL